MIGKTNAVAASEGGNQPQLFSPIVAGDATKGFFNIKNVANNGGFVDTFELYLNGTKLNEFSGVSNYQIDGLYSMIDSPDVYAFGVKCVGTNFRDSALTTFSIDTTGLDYVTLQGVYGNYVKALVNYTTEPNEYGDTVIIGG